MERARIARIDIVTQIADENEARIFQPFQTAPNIKFRKQNIF